MPKYLNELKFQTRNMLKAIQNFVDDGLHTMNERTKTKAQKIRNKKLSAKWKMNDEKRYKQNKKKGSKI